MFAHRINKNVKFAIMDTNSMKSHTFVKSAIMSRINGQDHATQVPDNLPSTSTFTTKAYVLMAFDSDKSPPDKKPP